MDDRSEPARLDRRLAVVVALLALLVRVGYEAHLHGDDGPVGRTGTAIMGDERAYDALARSFADGTFERERAFYQEPLYAWLVGRAYRAAPPAPHALPEPAVVVPSAVHAAIFWSQHLLGVVTAVLVAALGVRAGGPRVGVIAGVLAALSGPAVFHEAMLLKSSAGLFVFTATLLLWTDAWRDGGRLRAVALGALTGVGILLRGNMYLLLPLVCLSLALRRHPRGRGAALLDGVVCGLAALVPLLPVTWHNVALGDRVLTTYQAGTNAVIGMPDDDSVRAAIAYQPLVAGRGDALYEETDAIALAERLAGRELASHEVSDELWDEWRRRVAERPGTAALRGLAKAASTFHGDEIPDVKDWQFFRRTVGWLGTPLSDFHLVGPLALLGVFVALRSRRPGRRARLVVLAGLGVVVVTLALFYVMGRYRLSAAPCLWILAALAVDAGWRRWTSGSRALPAALGLAVLAFGLTTWTGRLTIRPDVHGAAGVQASWVNDASVSLHRARTTHDPAAAARHRDLAVAAARRALELAPRFPAAHATLVRALDLRTDVLAPRAAEATDAAWRMLLAMESQRTGIDAVDVLGRPLRDVQAAAVELRGRPSRPGGEAYAGRSLAFAARRVAQDLRAPDELPLALDLVDASLELEPDSAIAWLLRADKLRDLGRLDEALESYRRAEALGVSGDDAPKLHNNLGNLLLDLGRPTEALPRFERAAELLPGNPTIAANIARARAALDG